ncbi:ParB/RepB/Spo0J family partition protein [Vampirovibrio sp.]|uniref:ParB/RepB/Spo0J family partition protein n=1 Tax=Vampirovibrio sp. TaxID=2717857 RepID=UPI00359339CB
MQIDIQQLHPDPRNSNVCPPDRLAKIETHIKRTHCYPVLIVRPHPQRPGEYLIIDGHHRLEILRKLNHTQVDCQVWEMDEQDATLALATLNTLRGTDDIRKRAELVNILQQDYGMTNLANLLPETETQIQDLLAILKLDEAELEKAVKAQIEAEKALLPIPYTFMLFESDAKVVEEALALYQGEKTQQFIQLCHQHLEKKHA